MESREDIRVNKYLSQAGLCSRREADRLLDEGKIYIEDKVAKKGDKVCAFENVYLDGKPVNKEQKDVFLAFHKPKGIVCTTAKKDKNNIVDYINYETRIYPVGRLDKDSEGLIFLTNQGELMDKILRGSNYHEKEYITTVNRSVTESFLKGMREGVPILDKITRPCTVEKIDETSFRIILTQGLNRQIRRMCEYFSYRVVRLQRVRIMNIHLGTLKEGSYRYLTQMEFDQLKGLL